MTIMTTVAKSLPLGYIVFCEDMLTFVSAKDYSDCCHVIKTCREMGRHFRPRAR